MFKFFDSANSGLADLTQFARVLEKTGMYYSDAQVKSLFASYDPRSMGFIDYRQLAAAMFNGRAEKSRPMTD
jgi:Ca2+-binding EF-hand superfamily protein